jgi:predicted NBD/HSP70 family sugar kinase
MKPRVTRRPRRILVLDVGGSHIRVAHSAHAKVYRIPSGPSMDPTRMMKKLARELKGERYSAVSIGYPGLVIRGKIRREPHNLAKGWVDFDFARAFGCPTRIVNDAAMQALGSYGGGNMLFLGLGTGLGTAMIYDGALAPMELAHLAYKKGRTYEDYVGERGLLRLGKKKWEKEVYAVVETLSAALEPDYVMLGGGNVRKLKQLPPGVRRGDNLNAIVGGIRLWADPPSQGTAESLPPLKARKIHRTRRKGHPAR